MFNKEEYEKNQEILRKETLKELNQINKEIKINRKRKLKKVCLIFIIIVLIIKIFFKTIEINNIFGYPASKARFYKVTVNEKQVAVDYIIKQKIPIIPFVINFNSNYIGNNSIVGNDNAIFFESDGFKKYIIDISSFSCYSRKSQIECKNNQQMMKKNNDTKFTKLRIVRTNNPYEEMYNGKFKSDITEYVSEKGVYTISVIAKHHLTLTEVYFYFVN